MTNTATRTAAPYAARAFLQWYEAGFTDIVSVIPPGARLSPGSKIDPTAIGKIPGDRGPHGWRSWDWLRKIATPAMCARWQEQGASIGLKSGRFVLLDLDILEPAASRLAIGIAAQALGETPQRVGLAPKTLLIYRLADGEERMRRLRLWFKSPTHGEQLVEVLGEGQHAVVEGVHPKTGRPYVWNRHPVDVGASNIPTVTAAQVQRFLAELAGTLDAIGYDGFKREDGGALADRASVSQTALAAPSLQAVEAALRHLPNTNDLFESRTDYIRMGCALKASLPEHQEEARALWVDWALSWEGNERASPDPDVIVADWERMRPPFEVGWGYIKDTAAQHGFIGAATDFEPIDDEDEDDEDDAVMRAVEERSKPRPKRDLAASVIRWDDVTPQIDARDFVEGLLGEGAMSVVYGDSNVGKTFWVADLAFHVASGRKWRDRDVSQGGVIYCALEGAHGMRNRIAAMRKHFAHDGPVHFALLPTTVNLLDGGADVEALVELIRHEAERLGIPVRLVVVDTLSRAISGGNENAPDDMGALVTHADTIRHATEAHLLFVHHSGKDAARGARGHSLLRAATDTEIEIERTDDGEAVASVKKQREMGGGERFGFRLVTVDLGVNARLKTVASCVVEPVDAAPRPARSAVGVSKPRKVDIGLQALQRAVEKHPMADRVPVADDAGDVVGATTMEAWRVVLYDMLGDDLAAAKRQAFARSKKALLEQRLIGISGKYVWLKE